MVFISIEDFFNKTESLTRMTSEEEIECVRLMKEGNADSRERLIESYLPFIASHVKRAKPHLQTLGLVMYYIEALEKAVDSFDFSRGNKAFMHHLNRYFRQALTNYIVR